MPDSRGVTLLWALRSPCSFDCRYCYFGTIDELKQRSDKPIQIGTLSHLRKDDASLDDVLRFIHSFSPGTVRRAFIAGGEPLNWPGVLLVLSALKAAAVEVIVCTNGVPLADELMSETLVGLGVNSVSVSLDSHDREYNDEWRVDRKGTGWQGVVSGLRSVLRARDRMNSNMKVGVYSVITKLNIDHIVETARFVADLGVDYFIFQPVSLSVEHRLSKLLSLDISDRDAMRRAIEDLRSGGLKVHLPNRTYLKLVIDAITMVPPAPIVEGCFGGRDLFFIEPDGSVWDCPSMYRIAATSSADHLSIRDVGANTVFSPERRSRNTDCGLFSVDCVNMWQLMAFDEILV